VDQSLGELHHLLHTGGEGPELAISRLAETDIEKGLMRPFEGRFGWEAAKFCHQTHEVNRGHARDKGVVLGHVTDLGAELLALIRQ